MSQESRAAYIARRPDSQLREEVASLLRASDAAASFLDAGPYRTESLAFDASLQPGCRIGAWRIVRLIGHGGMGEVYEALRADGQFNQRAALKITRHDAANHLQRFILERQILARLDHPGITRLLDGGIAPDGRPYAVMEYVEGDSLFDHCAAHGADLRVRLHLFLQICDAVAYAHRNLIVHRDIKPGNVLVGPDGRARLLDFGIARPLDAGEWDSSQLTAQLLTPDYAAPEQLEGQPVTIAADIYALGLLLFELLVGRRPWQAQASSLAHFVTGMFDRPPPRASCLAAEMGDAPIKPRDLRGDLDAIIAKCLRQDPQLRYASVNALKTDIESSLRGDPVLARDGAGLYGFTRLMRRHRWVAVAVLMIIAVATAATVATYRDVGSGELCREHRSANLQG